jgi:polysaccharide pyruvyl transferase WcaK-like protein
MPLIAYQRAHGNTDFPHHFAFFEALEERGVLEKYDFAIDTFMDTEYCKILTRRFPQLLLAPDVSLPRKLFEMTRKSIGKGYRFFGYIDKKFDAVCEAPGGRITPIYSGGLNNFWMYPAVKKKAILFHSIEEGILPQRNVVKSLADCDLIIARTDKSAAIATEIGAKRVVKSCDIVFRRKYDNADYKKGIAVALRCPNLGVTDKYLEDIKSILNYFENSEKIVDHVRIEEPLGAEMEKRGYRSHERKNVNMFQDDYMYDPFRYKRDAIISCRLHTTIIGLLSGNLNIMQFQIESGTSKLKQFIDDLSLNSLTIHNLDEMNIETISNFMNMPVSLDKNEVDAAIKTARKKVEIGLDAFEEWLEEI